MLYRVPGTTVLTSWLVNFEISLFSWLIISATNQSLITGQMDVGRFVFFVGVKNFKEKEVDYLEDHSSYIVSG